MKEWAKQGEGEGEVPREFDIDVEASLKARKDGPDNIACVLLPVDERFLGG